MVASTSLLKEKKICNHRINIRLRAFIPLKNNSDVVTKNVQFHS